MHLSGIFFNPYQRLKREKLVVSEPHLPFVEVESGHCRCDPLTNMRRS